MFLLSIFSIFLGSKRQKDPEEYVGHRFFYVYLNGRGIYPNGGFSGPEVIQLVLLILLKNQKQ